MVNVANVLRCTLTGLDALLSVSRESPSRGELSLSMVLKMCSVRPAGGAWCLQMDQQATLLWIRSSRASSTPCILPS